MKFIFRLICIKATALITALSILVFGLLTADKFSLSVVTPVSKSHYENVIGELINPNASEEAKELMKFLKRTYGNYVLSGQYLDSYQNYDSPQFLNESGVSTVFKANELVAISSVNGGKLPAVIGLDFTGVESDVPGEWSDYTVRQAIEWHENGGIVTFSWHWGMAKDINGSWSRYDSSVYSEDTNFSLSDALRDKNSLSYKKLLSGIDRVSAELSKLRDNGVPVLWRPLHEASGAWFWWGDSGKSAYLELYRLMYDIMTNEKGLSNLIWVWNGQNKNWYPGDAYCDIIGDDPYPSPNTKLFQSFDSSRSSRFRYHYNISDKKIIAMTENGYVPDIDKMFENNTKWLMFCTWMREFVLLPDMNNQPYGVLNVYSEKYTSAEFLRNTYANPKVLTLDEIQNRQNF